MLAEDQKEERANLIQKYYRGITDYEYYTDLVDGDNTYTPGDADTMLLQVRYKHINDLVVEYYDELKRMIGYAYDGDTDSILSESEVDNPPSLPLTGSSNIWWKNCDTSRLQESLFYLDGDKLSSYNLIRYNSKEEPYQRHPYVLWNQHNTILGTDSDDNSPDDLGWINANYSDTIDGTYNPFATGSNYRMNQPLEYYGDTNNLAWGRIIYNGEQVYRINLGAGSGTANDNGFTRLDTNIGSVAINTLVDGTSAGSRSSYFERMRYTFWGSGTEGSVTSVTITGHTGTTSGTIEVSTSSFFTPNSWYIFYHSSNTNEGWILKVGTETDLGGPGPYQWDYQYANWPAPSSGTLVGTWQHAINPYITEDVKKATSPTSNGRRNVWASVYSQYNTEFENRIDNISSTVTTLQSDLDDLINYDYEVVNVVCAATMGSDAGKSEASTMKNTTWTNWLTDWKSDVNDSGSGATYSQQDDSWLDTNLDAVLTDLKNVISFASDNYANAQSGILPDRRDEVYELLGRNSSGAWYVKSTDEEWSATTISSANENNTGTLIGSTFYFWRWYIIDARLNRTDGALSKAFRGYTNAYNSAIKADSEIDSLETVISNIVGNSYEYDISPLNLTITTNELDKITLEWDTVVSASSYRIERKDGQSGSWVAIETQYEYVDPGDPPNYDFFQNPSNVYEDQAADQGYQEFGQNFSDPNDTPPLSNTMAQYSFNISVDGSSAFEIIVIGADCQSWEALANIINEISTEEDYGFICEVVSSDIRITSNTYGSTSSISITTGSTGTDLFTALGSGPDSAVAGNTYLEEGKIYYYRIRVNNGYNESLDGGTINDKDWDSVSQWHIDEYSGDKATHGDAGSIFWTPPENVKVSGIHDNGVTASELHARIEWDASINVSKYKVYRSTLRNSGYIYIDDTTNTYYEDTDALPGLPYWYRITAVADSTKYEYYDDSDNLTQEFESDMSALTEDCNGKRLWQTVTLSVTTTDKTKVTLSWNSLSGANGYVIYKSNTETALFSYISKDDGQKYIETNTTFEDRYEAEQILLDEFSSTSDGISDTEYVTNSRYYFIAMVVDNTTYLPTIQQYYIQSPASGTWTCQNIVNAINTAFTNGLNNITCELVSLTDPHTGTFYRIKFKSKLKGERATIRLTSGTFGQDLLSLFTKSLAKATAGTGALIGVPEYYKVKAVEVIGGDIVRESEFSNISMGIRPVE